MTVAQTLVLVGRVGCQTCVVSWREQMTERPKNRATAWPTVSPSTLVLLVCWSMTALGVLIEILAWSHDRRGRHWPVARGEIVAWACEAGPQTPGSPRRVLVTEYRFRVGDLVYRGSEKSSDRCSDNRAVRNIRDRIGRDVQVHFNPSRPEESVLTADPAFPAKRQRWLLFPVAISLLFTFVAIRDRYKTTRRM